MNLDESNRKESARAVPITEIWERLGLPEAPEGKAFCSPFREDRNPSAQLGGPKNIFYDHAGGESLDGIALVRKVKQCGFSEALDFILGSNGNGAIHKPAMPKPVSEEKPNKLWPDLATARAAYDALPLARDDAEAAAFLEKDYGLPAQILPDAWRVYRYYDRPGIVYEGRTPAGQIVSYKWKSLHRNEKGKRLCLFLFGTGGYCALGVRTGEPAGIVVVAGEEKVLAATMAGYIGISPLTGEKAPDDELIQWLCEKPATVILCSDNDDTGRHANSETAQALQHAGFPGEDLHIIAWPEGFPEAGDLNDMVKQSGVDGLRHLLGSAPAQIILPRCLSAADFLAAPREPLAYHIEGILPEGGKLTFSATSKWGKSMWAIQTGLALAAGHCQWLGWKFGPPAKVLYLQAEIMDALLASRLQWIMNSMPPELDRERAARNFIIQEIADGRPNLMEPQKRMVVEKTIARYRPEILTIDPLSATCPGLEENASEKMGPQLDYFSELARRFGCAVILVHHHGKGNVSRGSSTFEAWPESDLSATFLDESHEIAKVEMRLRCAYNPGPVYWRMPTPDLPWFESMGEGWAPEPKTRARKASPKHVEMVLRASGEKYMSWTCLVQGVQELTDCSRRTAADTVKETKELGKVKYENALFSLPS